MSGIFGWSYPPGCNSVPGDEDFYCEVCGKLSDDCVCPECPVCGNVGSKKCYGYVNPDIYEKIIRLRERYFIAKSLNKPETMLKEMSKQLRELEYQIGGHGLELTPEQYASAMVEAQRLDDDEEHYAKILEEEAQAEKLAQKQEEC